MNSRPQIIFLGSQLIKCWGVYLNRPRVHFTENIHVQYFTDFVTKESSLINLRGWIRCLEMAYKQNIYKISLPPHLFWLANEILTWAEIYHVIASIETEIPARHLC